jgi:hypothetical protein
VKKIVAIFIYEPKKGEWEQTQPDKNRRKLISIKDNTALDHFYNSRKLLVNIGKKTPVKLKRNKM